jgi:hypothetical protein
MVLSLTNYRQVHITEMDVKCPDPCGGAYSNQ